jgi:hypothetical protein
MVALSPFVPTSTRSSKLAALAIGVPRFQLGSCPRRVFSPVLIAEAGVLIKALVDYLPKFHRRADAEACALLAFNCHISILLSSHQGYFGPHVI